jgi:alpha-N-arabinofuranosidase
MHAHNDFAHPDAVKPAPIAVQASGGNVSHRFAPASVTALHITLS